MTLEEYNAKMDDYRKRIINEYDPLYHEMVDMQYDYMNSVLKEIGEKSNGDPIMDKIFELFNFVIENSIYGNAIVSTDTEEEARAVVCKLQDDYSDYLLDAPEVYKDEDTGDWCIDCMFGGYYTPEWDGFFE